MGVSCGLDSWRHSCVWYVCKYVHYLPGRSRELIQVIAHLGIKGMLEDLTQGLGIGLRFACLRGIENGCFDPLGHGLPHQLG